MFTTLRRTIRESVRGHGSSASALRAAPAGTASSPRPRTRRTGIAEDPAERATAEARQPSQDRVPRHLTSSLDDRHLPTYAPTLMHEASKELGVQRKGSVAGDAVTWKALKDKVAKAKEDHRVDTKKKNLEALLKENKFAEVLAALEKERHPFSQELPKSWRDLWTKATETRDAFVRKQKEEVRAKEVARIEAKKKILESLMKEKKFEEVIKQCESENEFANSARECYDASDLEIWKSYSQMAKKEIERKERLIREAQELVERQKEEKRIKEKVTKLER